MVPRPVSKWPSGRGDGGGVRSSDSSDGGGGGGERRRSDRCVLGEQSTFLFTLPLVGFGCASNRSSTFRSSTVCDSSVLLDTAGPGCLWVTRPAAAIDSAIARW